MSFQDLINWFAGGVTEHGHTRYMNLIHCMGNDYLWIAITIGLDVAVAAGYGLIAYHWWSNQRFLAKSPAKRALANMRNIFVFCGLCGYIFIPIKMVWPAWRLYDFFLVVLVYFTWKYAWGAKDLKVVYNEIGRSQKLAADLEESRAEAKRKSYFLNAISHDLRTPLNGLMLQASLAEINADANDTAGLKQSLEQIKGSARAAAELLNHFLELGRLDWAGEPNHMTEVCLRDLVGQAIASTKASAEQKGLNLSVGVIPEGSIRTDRVKLERILGNLLHNAVKFTHEGGVTVSAEKEKGDVRIHVTDTGAGIAPEHHEMLFEEFFQVHNQERDRKKGFGLGLAISRRLARQLGGDLVVSSDVGKGSRFTIVLSGAAGGAGTGVAGGSAGGDRGDSAIACGVPA